MLVTTDDGSVRGFDAVSGAGVWSQSALLGRGVSGPYGLGETGLAVVGDYKGILYLIDAQTGGLVGRKKGSGGCGAGYLWRRRGGSVHHTF